MVDEKADVVVEVVVVGVVEVMVVVAMEAETSTTAVVVEGFQEVVGAVKVVGAARVMEAVLQAVQLGRERLMRTRVDPPRHARPEIMSRQQCHLSVSLLQQG